jgi:hypothetical protein
MVKTIFVMILSVMFLHSCSEFNKKKEDNNAPLAAAALLSLQQGSNCVSSAPAAAIDGANRTTFSVVKDGCGTSPGGTITTDGNISFSGGSFVAGATEGRFALSGSYTTSDGKINIEVVYTITADDGDIDVIGNATANGAVAIGPTFRITKNAVVPVSSTGTAGTFEKTVPSSPVNSEKTLCLEIHKEGAGAHVFGWSKACTSLTSADKGSYEFEREDFDTVHPGSSVGFRLKNSRVKNFTITQGKIGTVGKLLE